MPRTEIPLVVLNSTGAPQGGATVQVNIRGSGGTPSVLYAQETGGTTIPNPLTTNASGRVDAWLDEGQYSIVVSGAGLTTYTQHWDSKSGGPVTKSGNATIGNIGPSSEAGILLQETTFYRTGANAVRLNGGLTVDGSLAVGQARIIGTSTSVALQDSGGANLLSASFLGSSFADSINATRAILGSSGNNDAVITGSAGALRRLGVSATGLIIGNAAPGSLAIPSADSLTIAYAGGRDTLNLSSTATDTGITIGGDVELYRSAADVLKTPDTVDAGAYRQAGTALASTHLADTAKIVLTDTTQSISGAKTFTGATVFESTTGFRTTGDTNTRISVTPAGVINFGTGTAPADTTLARNSSGGLRLVGQLRAEGIVGASDSTAADTSIGAVGPAGEAGIKIGTDVTIYRSSADTARTNDSIYVGGELRGADGGAGQVRIGATGPGSQAGLVFGTTAPANLYLSAANTIRTDNNIVVAGNLTVLGTTTQSATQTSAGALTAAQGDTGQVRIGNVGGTPTIFFGTAENTSLYQDGADKLRTSDAFQVDGLLTSTGGLTSTGQLTINRATAATTALITQVAGVDGFRVRAGGDLGWANTSGTFDTTLGRSAAGVLSLVGTFNATSYQVGGTAFASTHLSDSSSLARLAGATFTGALTGPVVAASTRFEALIGSAAIPTYVFSGDTDTGVYSPGADQFGIATGGVSRLIVDASGAVTIPGNVTVGGQAVVVTNDARLTNGRTPSGAAGGSLAGTYPNPTIAGGAISNTEIAANAAIADTKLATITTANKVAASAIDSTIARLASPTFTGNPGAPTPPQDDNDTSIATTAYVIGQASSAAPLMDGVAAIGDTLRWARSNHVHPTDTSRAPAIGSSSITTLGTITTGVWNGSVISAAYIDPTIARTSSPTINNLTATGAVRIGGASDTVGFYGAAPVARQARPTTAAEIVTLLVNLGLCS